MSDLREALTDLVGEAWDDGNARGLDGWIGPNRGAGNVDPEAERAREQMVDRALALRAAHPVEPAAECSGRCYVLVESGGSYAHPDCPKHGVSIQSDSSTYLKCEACGSEHLICAECKEHQAFPVREPAPVQVEITDEAASAADQAVRGELRERGLAGDVGRAALEAAAPLLGPQPLLDREEIVAAVHRASHNGHPCITSGVCPRLKNAGAYADSVMEMARPMPTREQIAAAMWDAEQLDYNRPRSWSEAHPSQATVILGRADAVLALLNGTES